MSLFTHKSNLPKDMFAKYGQDGNLSFSESGVPLRSLYQNLRTWSFIHECPFTMTYLWWINCSYLGNSDHQHLMAYWSRDNLEAASKLHSIIREYAYNNQLYFFNCKLCIIKWFSLTGPVQQHLTLSLIHPNSTFRISSQGEHFTSCWHQLFNGLQKE